MKLIVLTFVCLCVPDEEKNMVSEVFSNAIDALSDEDKSLPQVGLWAGIVSCKITSKHCQL